MSWVANSPYGQVPVVLWYCAGCDAGENGQDFSDAARLRDIAVAHLEATGHRVTISRGTREALYPMATTLDGHGDD